LLVLSGESTMKDVEESDVKPEFIMKDCAELLEKIQ
jgi:ribonucleotide monophosphatase NagD (HAD superfamily)